MRNANGYSGSEMLLLENSDALRAVSVFRVTRHTIRDCIRLYFEAKRFISNWVRWRENRYEKGGQVLRLIVTLFRVDLFAFIVAMVLIVLSLYNGGLTCNCGLTNCISEYTYVCIHL